MHRFGSTLNPHLHFHCMVIDGVFDDAAADGSSSMPPHGSMRQPSPPRIHHRRYFGVLA